MLMLQTDMRSRPFLDSQAEELLKALEKNITQFGIEYRRTESLRLADAVRDDSRVHMTILKLFSHVDPTRKSYSAREFLTVYLPSLAQFYYLIYDILSQQL